MAKKGSTKGKKGRYEAYKQSNRVIKNATAKLERHLKKFPNDSKAHDALRSVSSKKIRKASENKVGWVTKQKVVKDFFEDVQNPQTTITKVRAVLTAKVLSFISKAPRLPLPVFNTSTLPGAPAIVFKYEPIQAKKADSVAVETASITKTNKSGKPSIKRK